jgi:hypothetical protein
MGRSEVTHTFVPALAMMATLMVGLGQHIATCVKDARILKDKNPKDAAATIVVNAIFLSSLLYLNVRFFVEQYL